MVVELLNDYGNRIEFMDSNESDKFFEYTGNLHIHSQYSDGAGSVAEIARSAKRAGLDFIILNDHAHMTQSLHLEDEGVYDGVYVFMGLEIGLRYHHYLAYGLSEMVHGTGLGPQEVIDAVNRKGGFGFLAHPFEKGMPFHEKSIAYTWNDVSVNGYTGICIWNFASRWKERVKTPFHGLFFLLFKAGMLKGPSRKTLGFWDQQCRERRVVAIGGSDAHGALFKWGRLQFVPLSYDYALNSINIHMLLRNRLSDSIAKAKKEIYEALQEGRLFVAHEKLTSATGFRFAYVGENGLRLTMGEEAPFEPGRVFVESPSNGIIRLIKDGVLVRQWRANRVSSIIEEKGVYRIEVYRRSPFFGPRPWIFSNPVYLR